VNKLLLIALLAWGTAFAGMMDADGNAIPDGRDIGTKLLQIRDYNIEDVTLHCDLKGYFIYDSTIYMCVNIRENVSKEELVKYARADFLRQQEKRIARDKRYDEWIKTKAGKVWKQNYDQKLKEKEDKGHK